MHSQPTAIIAPLCPKKPLLLHWHRLFLSTAVAFSKGGINQAQMHFPEKIPKIKKVMFWLVPATGRTGTKVSSGSY